MGDPEVGDLEGPPVIPIYSTPLGRLASFYYISHKTIRLYAEGLSSNANIEDLIYILSVRGLECCAKCFHYITTNST